MSLVAYDLRGIRAGKYAYASDTGKITYTDTFDVGNAMTAALELKYAEGRLYAESALRRYKKKLTGGSISIAVEALALDVQQKLFGADSVETAVGTGTVKGIGYNANNAGDYVGIGFYAPADSSEGADNFIAVFAAKALFAPPSMSYQTAGESINWVTPTTTGEFLSPDPDADGNSPMMLEQAECASEAEAKAWIKKKLGES